MVCLRDWRPQANNVLLMLADRNCDSPQFLHLQNGSLYLFCSCAGPSTSETWHVYFTDELKLSVKTLRVLKEECGRQRVKRAILVNAEGLTPFAQREEKLSASSAPVILEFFKKSELAFNLLRHHLVPRHVPLSAAEKSALLKRLNCKASALPGIRSTDPVTRYLGVPPGTVLRISRRFGCLEEETYFRVVLP